MERLGRRFNQLYPAMIWAALALCLGLHTNVRFQKKGDRIWNQARISPNPQPTKSLSPERLFAQTWRIRDQFNDLYKSGLANGWPNNDRKLFKALGPAFM